MHQEPRYPAFRQATAIEFLETRYSLLLPNV
jgi:hypothetical protein